ncbi:MAG: adenylate/guanylate cyclase domain-containing protein [Micrococcaceae bacterium]
MAHHNPDVPHENTEPSQSIGPQLESPQQKVENLQDQNLQIPQQQNVNEPQPVQGPQHVQNKVAEAKTTNLDLSEKAKKKTRSTLGWLNSLSIQSKILAMLLASTLTSIGLVGYFSSVNTINSLRSSVSDKLTQTRDSRIVELQQKYKDMQNNALMLTHSPLVIDATKDFTSGYKELGNTQINATQQKSINDFYSNVFIPRLNQNNPSNDQFDAAAFQPKSNQAKYLQATYTAKSNSQNVDQANKLDDAGVNNTWNTANKTYNPYFRENLTTHGFDDIMLVDINGNVVYTTNKGVDLGINILNGPFLDNTLEKNFQDVLAKSNANTTEMSDFTTYYPNYGKPTSFLAAPISENGKNIGALILHSDSQELTDIMTANNQWEKSGLGKTGEAFLVGEDGTMRSNSRVLLEHPDQYVTEASKINHMNQTKTELAKKTGSTVLIQKISNDANELAQQGQTGIIETTNYTGHKALVAYAPLTMGDIQWNILVEENTSEAFAPVTNFSKKLAALIAGLVLLMSLASLLFARAFTRPLQSLNNQIKKVAKGDYSSTVNIKSKDEFGQLADSFNNMNRSLRAKDELIKEQHTENRKILSEVMPAGLIDNYSRGDGSLTLAHNNATILYADLEGLRSLQNKNSQESSFYSSTNKLLTSFDETAARFGVERVRTMTNGYLVSCGLEIQRVDHTKRIVDFALELENIVQNFNRQNGTDLDLRIGIDTGSVSSGLVGKQNLSYDLWGDAVKMAHTIQKSAKGKGVFTTSAVKERLHSGYDFIPAGDLRTSEDTIEQLWEITEKKN